MKQTKNGKPTLSKNYTVTGFAVSFLTKTHVYVDEFSIIKSSFVLRPKDYAITLG